LISFFAHPARLPVITNKKIKHNDTNFFIIDPPSLEDSTSFFGGFHLLFPTTSLISPGSSRSLEYYSSFCLEDFYSSLKYYSSCSYQLDEINLKIVPFFKNI